MCIHGNKRTPEEGKKERKIRGQPPESMSKQKLGLSVNDPVTEAELSTDEGGTVQAFGARCLIPFCFNNLFYKLGSTHVRSQHRPLYNHMGKPAKSPPTTLFPIHPLFSLPALLIQLDSAHPVRDQQQPCPTALGTASLQLLRQAEFRAECSKLLIVQLSLKQEMQAYSPDRQ